MDSDLGPTLLRWTIGLMFLVLGIYKISNPSMVVGMVGGLPVFGAFLPAFWAWVLILAELVGGAALLAGWKTRMAVWPLAIILVVALLTVHLPAVDWANPMTVVPLFFHLIALAGLFAVYLLGNGLYAMED